ncbi:peptidoglycan-binding protein [Streptomyces sp. NPDC003247]|uniref:peptidoglycan-binding domain-containing protein n=1 Tax=Streptomyces sp. NPDC003247 TaxID=3364677 RepID=UPI00368F495A
MPTPAEPGRPPDRPEPGEGAESADRPVLEPIRVLRPRNTDALAELFREMAEDTGPYEAVPLPDGPTDAEAQTRELPPVGEGGPPGRRGARPHRAAVASVAVLAAALAGFACALLLPDRDGGATARTLPATVPAPATGSAGGQAATSDPDGPGTLREGDTGPEVTDLQQRLRRIPNVYDDGPTDGRYGTVLTEAVARFQLWYGVRGDETGVYGDDTRRDLESRTG